MVKPGHLDLGSLHTPLPVKIRAMRISAFDLIPTVNKTDSVQTGCKGQHSKICINEGGFLIMYGNYGGKRSLQCKPTMTKNFWEQDIEDLEVLEMCAVKGREEYLVCTIDTPRSIQLRSMKTGELLYIFWIRFKPGKICFLKTSTFLVVDESEDSDLKLVEFIVAEKITNERVLKVKLEMGKKTISTKMEKNICGLAPIKHQGHQLIVMVSRLNDVVQAIDYITGDVKWTNKHTCDDLQTESIGLCQDNVSYLYVIDKLCKRILWVSANGQQKRKLVDIPSVSNIYCSSWDNSQQRLFLLVVDHKSQEWLKGYRVTHMKPGTRTKTSGAVTKKTSDKVATQKKEE